MRLTRPGARTTWIFRVGADVPSSSANFLRSSAVVGFMRDSARIGTAGGAVKAAIARPSRLPYAARRGHQRSFMPMRRVCAVMVLIIVSACTQSNHAQQSATTKPEFVPIFNGKDLNGWLYGTT